VKPSGHFPEFPEILKFVSENTTKCGNLVYTPLQPETQKPLISRGFPGVPWDISGFRDFGRHFRDFGKPSQHFRGVSGFQNRPNIFGSSIISKNRVYFFYNLQCYVHPCML
jgi:hypothetical protein